MHLKKFARAWAASALVALGLTGTATTAVAQEKDKDPKSAMPMAAATGSAINLTIGGQVRFQMQSKKAIREAVVGNDRVVTVLKFEGDPTSLVLIGRTAGNSTLELTAADGSRESYTVVVQRDLELLKTLIKKTIPTASVEVTGIGDAGTGIILSGYAGREDDRATVQQLAEALGLRVAVNTITVGGGGLVPHVQLDVTLAKVDRNKARSRGANLFLNGGTASGGSVLGGLASTDTSTIGGSVPNILGLGASPGAPQFVATSAPNLFFGYAPWNFQLLLQALKVEGIAKLVAAPTLVARSGEEAELLVGQQIPVISAAAGINGPGVTYRPTGTELRFVPIVYGNGKIHLTINPRVASVNNAQALVTSFGTSPAFDEQRLTTSIICEPGQTVALGGLIQTTVQGTVTKVPHLGDIPYLGALFSVNSQTETETELIVLVTPRLIDPADCGQMPKALPGAETRRPDDFEFYLESVLEAPRGQRPIFQGGQYVPAWKSSHTAAIFPCAPGGAGGHGCATGGCAAPATAAPAATPKVIVTPPAVSIPAEIPPQIGTDSNPPSALLAPSTPERKTAGLPVK
jgi:pilus assembly protein CpaC